MIGSHGELQRTQWTHGRSMTQFWMLHKENAILSEIASTLRFVHEFFMCHTSMHDDNLGAFITLFKFNLNLNLQALQGLHHFKWYSRNHNV